MPSNGAADPKSMIANVSSGRKPHRDKLLDDVRMREPRDLVCRRFGHLRCGRTFALEFVAGYLQARFSRKANNLIRLREELADRLVAIDAKSLSETGHRRRLPARPLVH